MTHPAPADAGPSPHSDAASRHASNLELFLDLVFVFAITQLTGYLAHHLTPTGVLQSLLMAWLAWWLWSAFTWVGTVIDLEGNATTRVLVLAMIPAVLLTAVTIPVALTTHALWFGLAYVVVQLWVLGLQGRSSWGNPLTRKSFLRYLPGAMVAPVLVAIGGAVPSSARLVLWTLAALLNIASAVVAASAGGEWQIDPVHFAERHALFVIISLGEVLVAVGANASAIAEEGGLDLATLAAVVAAVAVVASLWWGYFAYIPRVFELSLEEADSSHRGQVARDFGTFGHVPLVLGIIAFAVVAKHLVVHPMSHLYLADRLMLAASVALYVGGLMALQWRIGRRVSPERAATIVVVALLALAGGAVLPGVVVVASVAVILSAMATRTWYTFRRTEIGAKVYGQAG